MLRALMHLLSSWPTVTRRHSKTTTANLPRKDPPAGLRRLELPRVTPLLTTMEEQTTPIRRQKATPATLFLSKSIEADPLVSCDVDPAMSVVLADVTSVIHLPTERRVDKGSTTTFLTDPEKTETEFLKTAVTLVEKYGGELVGKASVCNPGMEANTTASITQRSMEHVMSSNSNGQSVARPHADLVSLQGSAECTIADRPLCMTFDSGIYSPSEKERPLSEEDPVVTKDQQHQRLRHLKAFVETKLKDSSQPRKGALSEEIRDQLCKLVQASLATSRSENPSAPELFMEKALSSSLLVFENTKLSAEVAYLKKKVEILEDVAGTQSFATESFTPSVRMETISIGSQTDELLELAESFHEIDFGISDFTLSPETSCLINTALCRDDDFPQPSEVSTPGVQAPGKRQRRKIEVPTQLKVTTSTSYSSINPWADVDDKRQNVSSLGCWRGLCACFYNTSQARHH